MPGTAEQPSKNGVIIATYLMLGVLFLELGCGGESPRGHYETSSASLTEQEENYAADATLPDTFLVEAPADPSSTDVRFVVGANAPIDETYCSIDNGPFELCATTVNYSGLAAGTHRFAAFAIDTGGNADPEPVVFVWNVASLPSVASAWFTMAPAQSTSERSATFAFAGSPGVLAYECVLDDGSWSTCVNPITFNGLVPGSHSVGVRAVPSLGRSASYPAVWYWSIIEPAQAQPPGQPSNLWPSNNRFWGARNAANGVTFSWTPSTAATSFRVEISTSLDFVSFVWSGTSNGTEVTWSTPEIGRYYWRVLAINNEGSASSVATRFDTSTENPNYPIRPYPAYEINAAHGEPPAVHRAGTGPRRALLYFEYERAWGKYLSTEWLAKWFAGWDIVIVDIEYAYRRPGLRAALTVENPATKLVAYVPYFTFHDTVATYSAEYPFRSEVGAYLRDHDAWYRTPSNSLWSFDSNSGYTGTPPLNLNTPINLVVKFNDSAYQSSWLSAIDSAQSAGNFDALMVDYADPDMAAKSGGYIGSPAAYVNAVTVVFTALAARGYKVFGNKGFYWDTNTTTHKVFAGAAGWMAEHAIATQGRTPWWNQTEADWDANAKTYFRALVGQVPNDFSILAPDMATGAGLANGDAGAENLAAFRFEWLSSLIIAPSAYISYDFGPAAHGDAVTFYAEQYAALGTSVRYAESGSLRIQEFENGYAVVNISRTSAALWTPPAPVRRLTEYFREPATTGNTGQIVGGGISIPPEDGVLVLKP